MRHPSAKRRLSLSRGRGGDRKRSVTKPRDWTERRLVTSITVDPGGTFGRHSHPRPVLFAVNRGTLTLYRADGKDCEKSTFRPGDAFVEPGGDVHLDRNE